MDADHRGGLSGAAAAAAGRGGRGGVDSGGSALGGVRSAHGGPHAARAVKCRGPNARSWQRRERGGRPARPGLVPGGEGGGLRPDSDACAEAPGGGGLGSWA